MKEYFLVPASDLKSAINEPSREVKNNILNSDKLTKDTILDLYNMITRNEMEKERFNQSKIMQKSTPSEANVILNTNLYKPNETSPLKIKRSMIPIQSPMKNEIKVDTSKSQEEKEEESKAEKEEDGEMRVSTEEEDLKKFIDRLLPGKYVNEAYEMIRDLIDKEVIVLENRENAYTVKMNNYTIPLVSFVRGVFVKNASIVTYLDFFQKISPHITKYINNPKLPLYIRGKGDKYWFVLN